ncbi:MAG: competence/damage-inducible protein A [Paenibacillaceae bacterium]|nr:competence/damage-inducible protein A [Paenibacillaceae bacterium]
MKAEIIAVGTELLLGQIVNTNAQYLAEQCALIGVDVYFQTVVGDNEGRLVQALDIAKGRADVVICTGGLGPTQDDLTKDVLAAYTRRKLDLHEPSMAYIADFFAKRGIVMAVSNARQALTLEGADPLPNDAGMAVGVALTHEGTHYMLLPGPPREMKTMFDRYGKAWLSGVMTDELPLYSKMLKFAGIGESALEHALIDLIEAQTHTSIAPYAKEAEVAIRLTTRATDAAQAEARMAATYEAIRERVGDHLYATEDVGLEHVVVGKLAEAGLTLAVAESCTGGLLGDMLTSVAGSSSVFRGGVICYTNAVKHGLLGVPMDVLEGEGAPGAVSRETAALLAEAVRERTGADIGVAITGVAGPSPSEGKPVGLVFVGIAGPDAATAVHEANYAGGREQIKRRAAKMAMYRVWLRIRQP